MLAGIAGAAVPLLLHLLNRLRFRNRAWSAMMFLNAAAPGHHRWARWRTRLLLLSRMAVIALLSIALARPLIGGHDSWFASAQPVTAVILLDRSASMAIGPRG